MISEMYEDFMNVKQNMHKVNLGTVYGSIINQNPFLLTLLLENQINPDAIYENHPLLYYAIETGNCLIIKILLEFNANPNNSLHTDIKNSISIYQSISCNDNEDIFHTITTYSKHVLVEKTKSYHQLYRENEINLKISELLTYVTELVENKTITKEELTYALGYDGSHGTRDFKIIVTGKSSIPYDTIAQRIVSYLNKKGINTSEYEAFFG